MNRRTALQWLSRLLALGVAAVVAIPGVRYVLASVRRRGGSGPILRRVALLKDLKPGQPFLVAIIAQRRDAWTTYPEEAIGRAWLVRRTDEKTPNDKAVVDGYSIICPHLGCAINLGPNKKQFECPCHDAKFNFDGATLSGPSPRPMDSLETKVVSVDGDWWVEVRYEQFARGGPTKVVVG